MGILFEEFMLEATNPSKNIFVLSGDYYWKKEFLNMLEASLKTKHTLSSKNIKNDLEKLRYKPLSGKTTVLYLETNGELSNKDIEMLKNYIKEVRKKGYLIISLKDFKEKRKFHNEFRFIRKSSQVTILEFEWLDRKFLVNFVRKKAKEIGVSFEDNNAIKQFIVRIGEDYRDITDNLYTLKEFTTYASAQDVKELIEDNSGYTEKNLAFYMLDANRKRIPYQSLYDVLSSDIQPTTLALRLRRLMNNVMQAKIIKMKGILRTRDIVDMRRKAYDLSGLSFPKGNIMSMRDSKIREFMELSDLLTFEEILYIQNCLEECLNYTDRSAYTTITKLHIAILKILSRRFDTSGKKSIGS